MVIKMVNTYQLKFNLLVPSQNLDEKSPPEYNDDLNGYYTIYMASELEDVLQDLKSNQVKQLSPEKVSFTTNLITF